MYRAAVLDLGSNTFHILIIEKSQHGFVELVRKRLYVKLAIDGIEQLSEASMERGLEALSEFRKLIDEHGVDMVKVIGTAALRTAKNGPAYMERIRTETGLSVELIDGIAEARYIYLGVNQVWQNPDRPVLIMDIGGGSVEYIIADSEKFYWSDSYPVGVAVLYRNFHRSDPITNKEVKELETFLEHHLKKLREVIKQYQPTLLLGASGTFDVIGNIIATDTSNRYHEVETDIVKNLIEEILVLNEEQRLADERIPNSRVDLIVVALLLLKYTLALTNFKKIGISHYALKEGVASTLF